MYMCLEYLTNVDWEAKSRVWACGGRIEDSQCVYYSNKKAEVNHGKI